MFAEGDDLLKRKLDRARLCASARRGGTRQHDSGTNGDTVANDGISVEVLDLRTISPLDMEAILASVSKTGAAVILHEAVRNFGAGAEISSRIHEKLFDKLKGPVARVGGKFAPVPFSKPLEDAFLPSAEDLEAAVRSLASRSAVPSPA